MPYPTGKARIVRYPVLSVKFSFTFLCLVCYVSLLSSKLDSDKNYSIRSTSIAVLHVLC